MTFKQFLATLALGLACWGIVVGAVWIIWEKA